MKKHFILLLSIITMSITVFAQQEYKLTATSGQLRLNIPEVIIEGYNGNEIVFSKPATEKEVVDERAAGLRMINGTSFSDNTGLGLYVSQNGDEITVKAVGIESSGILTIRVPQNIKVIFKNTSPINQGEVFLKNLRNEIEVSTSYNKVKLENNTGPMNVRTLYGSVDAVFANDMKGPVSIVSVYGYVDVSLPKAAHADVKLSTTYGKVYAAEGLKIALDVRTDAKTDINVNGLAFSNDGSGITGNGFRSTLQSSGVNGKINGGGADVILKSTYENVYLRDK
ncbi:DUF4097 family beta strand repeat-containing protein [Pedobacter sp.]|uniref:DUF4097 family beta strand repeat-containing protein n=1 Tax=Pedobacter sp. TaxID=1411316 RepID=UPI003D7F8CD0